MIRFRARYFGPVLFIALCLATLCAIMAFSLFGQQATLTRILRENVTSRRAALELEECLNDLIALENDRVERVSVLHARAFTHLRVLREAADQVTEQELAARIDKKFDNYIELWETLPPLNHPDHETARNTATKYLETDVLELCQRFERFNNGQIEVTTEHHERTLRQLAWGIASVGAIGAVAGIVLGFGVARGLHQSIGRLRVQLRDAAGKLDPQGAEIVVTEEGDFPQLHAEMDQLTGRIERMVQELQQREREMLRTEQMAAVGQVAAGVAHEVRNPLTAIKMLVQCALENQDALTLEDLRIMENETRRAEQSLQTFLDFARPPRPVWSRLDLVDLIRKIITLLRGRLEKQRVEVRFDPPTTPAIATADEEQLRRVILNLCMNALDAMPNGGQLSIELAFDANSDIDVSISDTGPGITNAIWPRLMEPFVSGKETGLGLGLATSKRIVEQHGGSLTAVNRPEGGALFSIHLPIRNI